MFKHLTMKLADLTKSRNTSVPWFDYTKASAINTCPRWGLIRYYHNGGMAMPSTSRSMPLEMGGAAHQAFAVIRWLQLDEYGESLYGSHMNTLPQEYLMAQMFGIERMEKVVDIFASDEDVRQKAIQAAHYITETSGFYDDPSEKRRTLSNLNDSLIAYVDRTDLERCIPVVKDGLVGIEVPFSIECHNTNYPEHLFNFNGKIDGLMYDRLDKKYIVEENKTSSRMDGSWQDAWQLNHQPTGYCVAGGLLLSNSEPLDEAYILGLVVPIPKNYDLGGVARISCERRDFRFLQWENWLLTTYEMWKRYHDNPLEAPEYTHSCNRYFHSCMFIPLCNADSREEQEEIMQDMVVSPWDPLAGDA